MEWSPKAKGADLSVKLVHFWGQVHRVDGKTCEGLARAKIGPWGWASDLASLPGRYVLAVGQQNGKFDWTPDT